MAWIKWSVLKYSDWDLMWIRYDVPEKSSFTGSIIYQLPPVSFGQLKTYEPASMEFPVSLVSSRWTICLIETLNKSIETKGILLSSQLKFFCSFLLCRLLSCRHPFLLLPVCLFFILKNWWLSFHFATTFLFFEVQNKRPKVNFWIQESGQPGYIVIKITSILH